MEGMLIVKSHFLGTFTLFGIIVCWKASLQLVLALSTTHVEYIAITEGVKKALWLKGMIAKLGIVYECDYTL